MKFLVDEMCGRILSWLRILGFDTEYVGDITAEDKDTAALAKAVLEGRILITRDKTLATRARELGVKVVVPVESKSIVDVLASVFEQLNAVPPENPQPRCPCCNGELVRVSKDSVAPLVPPRVLEVYHEFLQCKRCRKVFWYGSHWRYIRHVIREVRRRLYGRAPNTSESEISHTDRTG